LSTINVHVYRNDTFSAGLHSKRFTSASEVQQAQPTDFTSQTKQWGINQRSMPSITFIANLLVPPLSHLIPTEIAQRVALFLVPITCICLDFSSTKNQRPTTEGSWFRRASSRICGSAG
jgi:hypothetical protein